MGAQPTAISWKRGNSYGEPHPENGTLGLEGFLFTVDSNHGTWTRFAGYATAEEFDWLAERFGTPTLADCSDPTPYCSYGHRTKASCDCGPIAENE